MFNGKIHYKWPFSIAMLVYQRVFLTTLMILMIFDVIKTSLDALFVGQLR